MRLKGPMPIIGIFFRTAQQTSGDGSGSIDNKKSREQVTALKIFESLSDDENNT